MGVGDELLDQPRLADARVTGDKDQPAIAAGRLVQGPLENVQLFIPSDDGTAPDSLHEFGSGHSVLASGRSDCPGRDPAEAF